MKPVTHQLGRVGVSHSQRGKGRSCKQQEHTHTDNDVAPLHYSKHSNDNCVYPFFILNKICKDVCVEKQSFL